MTTKKNELKNVAELAISSTALWFLNQIDTKNGESQYLTKNESDAVGAIALLSIGAFFLKAVVDGGYVKEPDHRLN